ncbi:unnamed protein product, partial [Trichobilharzia regenti]
ENISTARDINQRWRPPWWSNSDYNNDNIDAIPDKDKLTASNYDSPFKPIPIRKRLHKIPGEGICINLFQRSIHVSTCACPIGYAGLGCMPLPIKYFHTFGLNPQRQILSYDAILLSLSNFGFIPAILLSVIHRLWIPALVYGYTFLFSTLFKWRGGETIKSDEERFSGATGVKTKFWMTCNIRDSVIKRDYIEQVPPSVFEHAPKILNILLGVASMHNCLGKA